MRTGGRAGGRADGLCIIFCIFLRLIAMYRCTFGKGWVGRGCLYCTGMSVLWEFLACESLHVCTVCIWRCEHARFCVDFLCAIYTFSFIHSFITWVLIFTHLCWHFPPACYTSLSTMSREEKMGGLTGLVVQDMAK